MAFHSNPFLVLAEAGGCVLGSAIVGWWLGQICGKPAGSLESVRGDVLAFYL